MPLASCATNVDMIGITWQKMSCCTSFQFLIRNTMIPFLMPLVSCDANISANVVFNFYYLDYTKALVSLMVLLLASNDAKADAGITLPKTL